MLTIFLISTVTMALNLQTAEAESETIIDTHGDSRFTKYPIGGAYWWSRSDSGAYNGNFWYTYCGDAAHGGDLYWGKWDPPFGQYQVFVWIPNPVSFPGYVPTHSANYDIYHSGGFTEISVNQASRLGGWYSIGTYTFASGSMINLDDRTGEPYASTMIAFDAIKFTPIVTYRTLTVYSAHDSPNPSNGAHSYSNGQSVTCSVTSPVNEGGTVWVCTGWSGTGSVPSSGSGTSVTFTITQDSSITWIWTTSQRSLTVYSSPSGVSFTANGVSHTTPWSGTYSQGTSVNLVMPSLYSGGDVRYYWDKWSDGVTSSSRTIVLNSDTTVTGNYIGPYYELTVASSPISGIPFTIDGASKTTTYSEWLYQGYYTVEMPAIYNGYAWQNWLEDGSTSRTRTVLLNTAVSLTAIYVVPSVPDFSITASPNYLTIQRGSSGSSTITITSINGFNQPVQLSVSEAPSGVTVTLSPSQVTPPAGGTATSTLTISVGATALAPPDTCTALIVTGTSGTIIHSTSISLEIPPLQKTLEHLLANPFPPNPSPYVRATAFYYPIDDATYKVLEVSFSSQGVNKGWIEFGIVDHDNYIPSVSPVPTDKWYTLFHTSGEERVFSLDIMVHRNDIMAMGFVGVASGSVYFGTDILVTLTRLSGDLIRNSWPVTTTFEPETPVSEVTSRATPFELGTLGSPGELRVYDPEGRITGFVGGQPTEEIPYSMIINETVVVFLPSLRYRYEVAGTSDGSYDFAVGSVENGSSTFFIATDIPTSPGANHQYTISWDALSIGEEGVIVEVDSDGNGVPEYTFTSDSELTRNEFLIQTGQSALYILSIVWGAETFTVSVESNSTVSNFAFSQPNKQIGFNVAGEAGTIGFCNVTIPKALLYGEPWIVLIDGASVLPTITENATHTSLHFTYAHSTHTIQIIGTWVIGPPPDTTPPLIQTPFQQPEPAKVTPDKTVTVYVNVTDMESGVKNVILSYTTNGGATWNNLTMLYNATTALYQATIPAFPSGTNVCYKVIAYDNADNVAINDNAGQYYCYTVNPPAPPPLSVSISPLSASILAGQSVTFASTVSGGYTPYSYQWYLNGNPVSGATSASWTFTPTASGIYYICLKVTDDKGNAAQSDAARITAATIPVGGYSITIQVSTKAEPVLPYIALIASLTAIFTKLRPKTKRKR